MAHCLAHHPQVIITFIGFNIASFSSAREAREKLGCFYANMLRPQIMALKEKLFLSYQGTKIVFEFLQTIKSTANQLALIGAPLEEDDIILHCLNGFNFNFKEISTSIHAREQPIPFRSLHNKLVEFKDYLK